MSESRSVDTRKGMLHMGIAAVLAFVLLVVLSIYVPAYRGPVPMPKDQDHSQAEFQQCLACHVSKPAQTGVRMPHPMPRQTCLFCHAK